MFAAAGFPRPRHDTHAIRGWRRLPARDTTSRQRAAAARSLALVKRLAAMLAALALGLAVPTLAAAQLGPTNIPAPLTQTDDSERGRCRRRTRGLTTLQLVLIFGAAIGVIALIGCVIMRDARRAAPAAARASAKGAPAPPAAGIAEEQGRARARAREGAQAQQGEGRAQPAQAQPPALNARIARRTGALTFGNRGTPKGSPDYEEALSGNPGEPEVHCVQPRSGVGRRFRHQQARGMRARCER